MLVALERKNASSEKHDMQAFVVPSFDLRQQSWMHHLPGQELRRVLCREGPLRLCRGTRVRESGGLNFPLWVSYIRHGYDQILSLRISFRASGRYHCGVKLLM